MMSTGYLQECIHELIDQQSKKTGKAVALVCGEERVTYEEMSARANQLARYIVRRHGVAPEMFVGVLLPSSVQQAIAVLAILKAGAAYLGLNLGLPDDRLNQMIGEARPRLVLTTSESQPRIFSAEAESLCLDQMVGELEGESEQDIVSGVTPENMALVRFTSGTSGVPKAVVNTHRSLTNRLRSRCLPDIEGTDICALNSAAGFGSRLLYPLTCGAQVVLINPEHWKDGILLSKAIQAHGITSIYMVPSLLRHLITLAPPYLSLLKNLRVVTVGGDVLIPETISKFFDALPGVRLINIYGSTEIGTTATIRIVNDEPSKKSPSIGFPVVNTRVYILDDHMYPLPAGEVGEIYIAASHLARGYLKDPGLTDSRFFPDPWSPEPGSRMYKTGDLGRRLANGEIEFLGRRDRQLKIRGFRVEPEEIESVLARNPGIRAAFVVPYASQDGGNRICAYLECDRTIPLTKSWLRAYLAEKLPDHMIPSSFKFMEALPLNRAGKVDRASLPPPPLARPDLDSLYEPPRTAMEEELAEIWTSVLGFDCVGIHDNFLELGGDSLMAANVVVAVLDRLGIEVPGAILFERSTIAELALVCEEELTAARTVSGIV